MSVDKNKIPESGEAARKRRDIAIEIANTFEWLITAFILAFVFRAFIMEAFRIPTGSMADTLKGAHFRLCCEQCGYKYGHGFSPEAYVFCPHCGYICGINFVRGRNPHCPQCMYVFDYPDRYRLKQDTVPFGNVELPHTRCPSCGYEQGYSQSARKMMPVANGDRILVLKCIYQFVEPKRWDIIVFKNPLNPTENYIKRLIGLPEEKIEIIDGDIYINDRISRKPPNVQDELWTLVYDHDYQPARPREESFNGHFWRQPFKNGKGSKWIIDNKDNLHRTPFGAALLYLDSPADQINTVFYDTPNGKDFRAVYSYNDVDIRRQEDMPECSDLMVHFYADAGTNDGCIGITLRKYQTNYSAWVNSTGEMVIAKVGQDKQLTELKRRPIRQSAGNKPILVKFANVDHTLIFEYGSENLTYDLGTGPDDAGARKVDAAPASAPPEVETEPWVKIFGAGRLTLSHIAIFRDIHYTAEKTANGADVGRATEGNPFTLAKDEFFVLGDNSPNSEDGRWWDTRGVANNGLFYRKGIVPRDYLIGKALFVYWPSGFEFPWPESLKTFLSKPTSAAQPTQGILMRILYGIASLRWIPNVGQMRFVYGGSDAALYSSRKMTADRNGGQ